MHSGFVLKALLLPRDRDKGEDQQQAVRMFIMVLSFFSVFLFALSNLHVRVSKYGRKIIGCCVSF